MWTAFLVIILVSALAFFSIQQLIAASTRVERSQLLLIEINHFLSDLKDVETGGRGYALSGGDRRHLERQEQGIAATRATVGRLRKLAEDPDLRRSLEALFRLAEQRIASSRTLVTERADLAKTRRNLLDGMILMDRIRAQESVIFSVQQREYQDERKLLLRRAGETSLALAGGVALCLAVIAWLFALRGGEVERRRRLEEELRALNLELEDRVQERTSQVKRASTLLNAVVENLPDMVLLKEPSGGSFRYLLVNAAGEKLLGRDRSEIIGRTERDLFPAEEAALVVETNKAVAEAGQPRTFTDRKLTTAAGVRMVETRVVPIASGSGGPGLILALIRDVTDRKAREEQLRQLQRMDAIGRLTGGVAHDFNNLLAIIHGNSELLRNQLDDGSAGADMADDVIDASERGAELVRRLLAFARMQHLEPEAVDLNARLPSILGLLQRSLGEAVNVKVKAAGDLWPATVDPTQVDDAIVNLAINARDAMPSGGILTIETQNITLDEDYAAHHVEVVPGDYVMLAVSDTGTGMPPDVAARAFEPFFTTKQEGQGTGLGLSQVFGWVKQSRGHIKIYSELGHGTTIKLYLPRAATKSADQSPRAEAVTPRGDETVLVVEDNPKVRKTVIRQLGDLGYQTAEADSGAAALRLVRGGIKFDLLLTDVIMPGGMTGYQLADELRQSRPDLKVLFTSGYTELAAQNEHLTGKDSLLSKPYRKQDLGRAIRAALDDPRMTNAD
ncbi:response regulator [Sphingomonas sp. URHD0057]|uniref:response regulator n=1 Tax=Sphingomonas sp. URHD0057 TaxID=1380389 RepID=UPI0018CBFB6E|nr:response regulator [Sphingomonas sp. URHD0057]